MRKLPVYKIEKRKLKIGHLLLLIMMMYGLTQVGTVMGMPIHLVLSAFSPAEDLSSLPDMLLSSNPVLRIISVGILPAIFEELLFRKFLIDRVVNYGEVTAMLMSGLMFGLYHGNLAQGTYAFAIGCFLAFIYMRTGKIGYTIAIHMCINGFSTYLTKFMLKGINISEMQGYLLNGDMEGYMNFVEENMAALAGLALVGMLVILVVIVGLILTIVLFKKFVFEHHEEEIAKGNRFKTAVLNPGMILFIVYWIVAIIMTQLGVSVVDTFLSQLGG
jgi:membrane protease YdiL (CAAX protease family)